LLNIVWYRTNHGRATDATYPSGGMLMAEFNSSKKKKSSGKRYEKDDHAVSANFYGALKSKNELYFQMASLFKEATQVTKNQDEKKMNYQLNDQWIEKSIEKRVKQILTATPSDIHGNSFINTI
jgi:hypothetical protein